MASAHFANAPFFAFVELEEKKIRHLYIKANDATKLMRKKGMSAAKFVVDEKADVIIVVDLGEGPFHLLRDSLVQTYYLQEPVNVEKAINLLNENKLTIMTEPSERSKSGPSVRG